MFTHFWGNEEEVGIQSGTMLKCRVHFQLCVKVLLWPPYPTPAAVFDSEKLRERLIRPGVACHQCLVCHSGEIDLGIVQFLLH
mmetsp:Transcript_5203/g.6042  ORF Transcript_5203/g.6042 Transcript_5203/m.6042 type:complete len:83 (-) Transcript_5203:884-1132(-)